MSFRRVDYGKPVKNAVYAFTETFLRKRFFWKVTIVWIVSEYDRNLMAEWLKLPSRCPVELFDEKLIFAETSYFWWGVHTLGKTFLRFYERNWQECPERILHLRWNMLEKKWFTWKNFEAFIKFGLWTKEIHSRCVKPVF